MYSNTNVLQDLERFPRREALHENTQKTKQRRALKAKLHSLNLYFVFDVT